jgi:hypothetical protein
MNASVKKIIEHNLENLKGNEQFVAKQIKESREHLDDLLSDHETIKNEIEDLTKFLQDNY